MVQQHDGREDFGRLIQVVRGDEHGDAVILQRTKNAEERFLGRHIQSGQWFVQQQELGLLGQRASQKHSLLLPAGEFADLALCEGRHLHLLQRLLHQLPILAAGPAEHAHLADTSHHDRVVDADRKTPVDAAALRHIANADVARWAAAIDADIAKLWPHNAGNHVEQGALARAVGTDDSNLFASIDRK